MMARSPETPYAELEKARVVGTWYEDLPRPAKPPCATVPRCREFASASPAPAASRDAPAKLCARPKAPSRNQQPRRASNAATVGDTHRYIIEASSPCPECGCKTVRMVYDMGAMLGE
jgi:hypothetical protein